MSGKTIMLPEGTANYVSVFKARPPPNAKPGAENLYGVTVTYPKAGAAKLLAPVLAAALEVAEAKWPGKGAAIIKAMKWPIVSDGDERLNGNGDPMFPGEMFVVAKRRESFGAPGVVDGNVQRILDAAQVYAGAKVLVQVNLYPFNHPLGGKGVGVGLSNLQVVGQGERRDGRIAPEDAFEPVQGADDASDLL